MLGESEIISSENISVVERDGRHLLKHILYHTGHFSGIVYYICMQVIKKIESGERTWASDFLDLEHILLTMHPKAVAIMSSYS